jgi:heptosyltransferase-3
MAGRILLIHPGGLGDVLLALPAIRSLGVLFSPVNLVLMADSAVGTLLKTCREIAQLIPLESRAMAELLSGETAMPSWWTDDGFETAVCWMRDPQGELALTCQRMGMRKVSVGAPDQATELVLHQSNRLLEHSADIPRSSDAEAPLRLPLPVLDAGKRKIAQLIGHAAKSAVALHPGSGSIHKCSDPRLFACAARGLRDMGYCPILVGGPADSERIDAVMAECRPPLPVIANLELLAMAGVLVNVALFIGHDSGLTHLAAALHRPTIAAFGPTSPARWAPMGDHVRVITGEPCRCVGWDAVRTCRDRPCLQISESQLMKACENAVRCLVPLSGFMLNCTASPYRDLY